MILDAQNQFSDSQALTATAVGTNVIDLSVARSMGQGEPIAVLFTVDVAADQTTANETYTFDVETSSDAGQSAAVRLLGRRVFEAGTPTAPAQDADLLVAGFSFAIVLPPVGESEHGQFLGIRYVLGGTTPLITCSAHLQPLSMLELSADPSYASGYSIT